MRLLLVAATELELDPLVAHLSPAGPASGPLRRFTHGSHHVDVLTTGVGMVATATWCTRALAEQAYDLALNLGVCGSFVPAHPPGTVVNVVSDCFSELGAEDGEQFLTMQELGLAAPDDAPYRRGRLLNPAPASHAVAAALPAVSGITVNTVHGNATSIARVVGRYAPDIESMEGAAFMYACLVAGTPFAQVRAVSNMVERRNRAAWKLREAIDALTDTGVRLIERA
jgi:futalosine hydrolase